MFNHQVGSACSSTIRIIVWGHNLSLLPSSKCPLFLNLRDSCSSLFVHLHWDSCWCTCTTLHLCSCACDCMCSNALLSQPTFEPFTLTWPPNFCGNNVVSYPLTFLCMYSLSAPHEHQHKNSYTLHDTEEHLHFWVADNQCKAIGPKTNRELKAFWHMYLHRQNRHHSISHGYFTTKVFMQHANKPCILKIKDQGNQIASYQSVREKQSANDECPRWRTLFFL